MPDNAAPAPTQIADPGPIPSQLPPNPPPPPDPWLAGDFAIQAVSLSKRFGQHQAVDRITLRVPTGTFYGLLGPNGAGKSTTLAMATGLLRPDGGNVMVNGLAVWPDPTDVKATIGVVPENLLLFERLSAREFLTYVGRFRRLGDDDIELRTSDLLRALDLESADRKLIADYSQGMRKKISLAAALLHSPPLLILDEPFESVDPVSQRSIRHILDQVIARGRTVVFSSHVMSTVEELCDHIAIMDEGRIIRSGPMSQVTSGRRLDDVFAQAVGTDKVAPPSLDWLQ
jgi:ABC-2 type transport system ATP-binding protein